MSDDLTLSRSDADAILEAGRQLARHAERADVDGHPLLLVPDGLEITDLEEYLPAPRRINQHVTLLTPQAFCEYVALYADPARTLVFADRDKATFTAYLDYHASADKPSWIQHEAKFPLQPTPAWTDWMAINKKAMTQYDFAQFIEDHVQDIAEPSGADLMETVLAFEANKTASLSSSIRLADGRVKFSFQEDIQGKQQGSEIKVPTAFLLSIVPFEGAEPVALTARLRWRVGQGGALSIWIDILRLVDARNAAIDRVQAFVQAELDGIVKGVLAGQKGSTGS